MGETISTANTNGLPDWVEEERERDVATLRDSLPNFYESLSVGSPQWRNFMNAAHCEDHIPDQVKSVVSQLQTVLLIQAFRPDRLYTVMANFACRLLGVSSLTPNNSRISQVSYCSIFCYLIVDKF